MYFNNNGADDIVNIEILGSISAKREDNPIGGVQFLGLC